MLCFSHTVQRSDSGLEKRPLSSNMSREEDCPFLALPTELRLLIYGFTLLNCQTITIGSAEILGSEPDIVQRLYGQDRLPCSGILRNHEPVIETRYNSSLLSITSPAVIPASAPIADDPHGAAYDARLALSLVNTQVKEELKGHLALLQNRRTSLFVQYPHGLHILRSLTPHLLRYTQTVHIAGTYTPQTFRPARGACLPLNNADADLSEQYHGGVVPDSAAQLGALISSLFGTTPVHQIRKLEMRIYYPGHDAYSTVWGDDGSPTVIALRNIYDGIISIEIWRGQHGTGVYLTARHAESEDGRLVSTIWRRLEEDRQGQPKRGSWVVDPKWPAWDEENDMGRTYKSDEMVDTDMPI